MSNIPSGVKAPEDHNKSKVDVFAEGLAGIGLKVDTLPLGLRLRQRNEVMGLALSLRELVNAEDGAEEVEFDTEDLSDEQVKTLLGILADFDDLMAREALDTQAYDDWSRLAGYDDFSTLLTLYAGVLGESTSSTS